MSAECRRYRDEGSRPDAAGDEEWRRHLRDCPRCARQARLDALLREGYGALPEARLSAAFDDRLGDALDAERAVSAAGARREGAGDARPGRVGRWLQRLYWVAASGASAALLGRVVEAGPGPLALGLGAGAGLLLGLVLLGAARALRASPGLLIARSL